MKNDGYLFVNVFVLTVTALFLFGASTRLFAQQSGLKAAMAFRTVNPSKPAVPIGHLSTTPRDNVYADLRVQAIGLEDAAGRRLIWLGWDFCDARKEMVDRIKNTVQEKYGIAPEAFCINASHTHSAPPLVAEEAVSPELFDPEYADYVVEQILAVVADVIEKMAPAKLSYHHYPCTSIAINRRLNVNGDILMQPNLNGPVDHQVQVIKVASAKDNQLIGVVVKYACHPVTVGPKGLGSDYPGFMRADFERRHPGSVALFLQGCGADVRIQVVDDDVSKFVEGSIEAARRFGRDLSMAVEWAMNQPGDAMVGPIEPRNAVIDLPLGNVSESEYRRAAEQKNDHANWGRYFCGKLDRGEKIPTTWPYHIQVFQLGAHSPRPFILVALQDEVVTQYGLQIQQRLKPANTIVLGYSNDITAYLCTAEQIKAGGYEPTAYLFWTTTPGPYTTKAESLVINAAENLARSAASH